MHPLLLLFLIHFFSPAPAAADIAGDTSALLSFRNSVGRLVLPWNTSLSPCKWKGVTCTNNRVTSLRLPGRGLSGQIPAGTLSNLSDLRVLSLHHNRLSGPLPSDLAGCTQLVSLYLNKNRFFGEFPRFISSITSLIRVNLADNEFSGEIPPSLNSLKQLNLLYLENNHFGGELPNLDLPKLKWFNVSFNTLTGPVPENLRGEKASSFSNTSLCGSPLPSCSSERNSNSLSGGAIAGIAVGAVAVFLLIIVALFLFFRFKAKAEEESLAETVIVSKKMAEVDETSPVIGALKKELFFVGDAPRIFDLEDLLRASAEVLGKGSCGVAYKAAVREDLVVAVKRLKNVKMGEEEFAEKIKAISAMKHPNIVPLRAYYYSRAEKLLVYDYMPLGSLSSLLHGNRGSLNRVPLKWESRIKIALDAAAGIKYIHSTSPSASHGNIKSSNILITNSHQAQLSDHCHSQLAPSSRAQNSTPQADVFSFGVLLLELVSGKAVANLRQWVESFARREWIGELFDEELKRHRSPEEEMGMLLQVGFDCTSQNPEHRPEMSSVVAKIEEIRCWAARKKDKLKEKEGF